MQRIGYVRTSKSKQYTDRQINELQGYCDKVYVEQGISGRNKNRPIFKRLLKELEEEDELVVISFDRAFRSVIDGLTSLDVLTQEQIALVSLTQRIDPATPDGRLCFTMILAVAEWELNILSWRTIAGLQAAIKRGVKLGRPKKGHEKNRKKDKRIVLPVDANGLLLTG